PQIFAIDVNTIQGKTASFGMNNQETFVNNLSVDSNGNGLYKRINKNRTLTVYLIKNLLEGEISINELDKYLDTMEVVNAPNFSTHNLVVDKNGNIYVVEPGRGNIKNKKQESPYFVMTNFSLIDYNNGKKYNDNGFDRYEKVNTELKKAKKINVKDAFKILEKVKQDCEWKTEFSMVYSQKNKTIYYCYNSKLFVFIRGIRL
ncbi:MAG: hypothetical protein LBB72_02645, partial [Spirochaetaceae bacterium]|nr:hypothetical protein [Spirochaetaceae bacterium]